MKKVRAWPYMADYLSEVEIKEKCGILYKQAMSLLNKACRVNGEGAKLVPTPVAIGVEGARRLLRKIWTLARPTSVEENIEDFAIVVVEAYDTGKPLTKDMVLKLTGSRDLLAAQLVQSGIKFGKSRNDSIKIQRAIQ